MDPDSNAANVSESAEPSKNWVSFDENRGKAFFRF